MKKNTLTACSPKGQDTKQRLKVTLEFWIVEYPFIAITPRSTSTQSGSACYDPLYRSNIPVRKLFVFDRNTRYHITV